MAWTLAAALTPTTAGARRDSRVSRSRRRRGLRAAGVNVRVRGAIVGNLPVSGRDPAHGRAATPQLRKRTPANGGRDGTRGARRVAHGITGKDSLPGREVNRTSRVKKRVQVFWSAA